MHMDIQARGFTLTAAINSTVRREAASLASVLGEGDTKLMVRLFDVNSVRGGFDKGCLISAHISRNRRVIVASSLETDLYFAIPIAFEKLRRGVIAAARRDHTLRRRARGPSPDVSAT
ncbi:MAG: HPF/RaiA family ribosome-associated protein [Proteobacteria bacterium]|nr:HPF/RaiA family ribosome-associated protein [Pseudomonadota bacterium]